MGMQPAEIIELLQQYKEMGVRHIVALRGDIPSGMGSGSGLRYANELVELIKTEFGSDFRMWKWPPIPNTTRSAQRRRRFE